MTPWEELAVGTETGRITLTVTAAAIDEYNAATGDTHPWFAAGAAADSPYGTRVAPPDMLPKLAMDALFQDFLGRVVGRNMRAKQEFSFHAPLPVGSVVTAVGHLVERYERRGKRFITLEGTFRDQDGRVVLVDRRTQYIPQPAPGPASHDAR
ncbi:hypothetical protein GCM10023144_20510 [Pigmentiphaga soli]|uniref:FAS1-like dehydratase domain-containing protein n=1 Tax=Pigmentiphaga soli TaxID=1007095 RepID=A0ABP8GY65_9BURK